MIRDEDRQGDGAGRARRGAGSRVYLVRRDSDSWQYALKVVQCAGRANKRFLDQVKNEFRIGRLLEHPNLIDVYCLETDAGWFRGPKTARLLTQYAPGRTMDRLPLLPVPRLLGIFERIAAAVAYMHGLGIVHGDIKPNNLVLAGETNVKLIDYGIAQFRGEHPVRIHATRDFMAPETGSYKLLNERTDVYSFGATMYRLATLQAPPTALTAVTKGEQEFERRFRAVSALNPRIPAVLSDLIAACLRYDPESRPTSMEDVRASLAAMSANRTEHETI